MKVPTVREADLVWPRARVPRERLVTLCSSLVHGEGSVVGAARIACRVTWAVVRLTCEYLPLIGD